MRLSQEPWFFIAGRALQGVGGALMVPVGRLVVLRTTPKSGILRAMALLTWPALTAPLIGPAARRLSDRRAVVAGDFLRQSAARRRRRSARLGLDAEARSGLGQAVRLTGFALAAVASGSALVGLDAISGAGGPWIAAALLGLAAAAGWAFLARMRGAAHPLVDLRPLRYPSFRLCLTGGTAARAFIGAMPFLLPLTFQLGMGFDALRAGLTLIPLFIGNIGIKPFTTPILRFAGFRRVLIFNAVVQAATCLPARRWRRARRLCGVAALLWSQARRARCISPRSPRCPSPTFRRKR